MKQLTHWFLECSPPQLILGTIVLVICVKIIWYIIEDL